MMYLPTYVCFILQTHHIPLMRMTVEQVDQAAGRNPALLSLVNRSECWRIRISHRDTCQLTKDENSLNVFGFLTNR